jgi:hypothetical protein
MKDYRASIEKLRRDAAEAALGSLSAFRRSSFPKSACELTLCPRLN